MRRFTLIAGLLGLSACASNSLPDRVFPVFFTEYSSTIDAPAAEVIARAAAVSKRFPTEKVHVIGYADTAGTPAATVAISKARADAVAALLVQDGVAPELILREAVGTPPNSQPGIERRRVEVDVGS